MAVGAAAPLQHNASITIKKRRVLIRRPVCGRYRPQRCPLTPAAASPWSIHVVGVQPGPYMRTATPALQARRNRAREHEKNRATTPPPRKPSPKKEKMANRRRSRLCPLNEIVGRARARPRTRRRQARTSRRQSLTLLFLDNFQLQYQKKNHQEPRRGKVRGGLRFRRRAPVLPRL